MLYSIGHRPNLRDFMMSEQSVDKRLLHIICQQTHPIKKYDIFPAQAYMLQSYKKISILQEQNEDFLLYLYLKFSL